MRHDNLFFFLDAFGGFARPADFSGATHQFLDDAFNHLHHIGLALTQIRVVKGIKLFDQRVHLLHQRPLGIAATFTDQGLGYIDQFRVLQNQGMHVDKRPHLGRRLHHLASQLIQFDAHPIHGLLKTRDLFFQLSRRQRQMRDFQRRVRQQLGMTNGNATGNAKTVQGKAHGQSSSIRLRRNNR